jgi:hypothetical protein
MTADGGKKTAVSDGDERFVVQKKRRPIFRNFESGGMVRRISK